MKSKDQEIKLNFSPIRAKMVLNTKFNLLKFDLSDGDLPNCNNDSSDAVLDQSEFDDEVSAL